MELTSGFDILFKIAPKLFKVVVQTRYMLHFLLATSKKPLPVVFNSKQLFSCCVRSNCDKLCPEMYMESTITTPEVFCRRLCSFMLQFYAKDCCKMTFKSLIACLFYASCYKHHIKKPALFAGFFHICNISS